MSRKHFRQLAANLKASNASLETCQEIADTCKLANPRFDRSRFLEACGH